MSVVVDAGPLIPQSDGFHRTETATGAVSLTTNVSILLGGTATGFDGNAFTLADGREGQDKGVLMNATGEATLALTGTATGRLVFGEDDFEQLKFVGDKWRRIAGSASVASAT